MLFGMTYIGCASAASTAEESAIVALEGTLSQRGSEPYTALVLETNQRNIYVLNLDEMQRDALTIDAPRVVRVTGMLYEDTWNGRAIAHIRVKAMLDLSSVEYRE